MFLWERRNCPIYYTISCAFPWRRKLASLLLHRAVIVKSIVRVTGFPRRPRGRRILYPGPVLRLYTRLYYVNLVSSRDPRYVNLWKLCNGIHETSDDDDTSKWRSVVRAGAALRILLYSESSRDVIFDKPFVHF